MARVKSPEEQLIRVQEALPKVSGHYDGEAIFIPKSDELARQMGLKSHATLYAYGTNYAQKMELVTGLQVVHNGLVLGHPDLMNQDFNLPTIEPIEPIARQIESLSEIDRARLMARIAISGTTES